MEQTGWKLLHGKVFRTPTKYMWLCCALGSGVQIGGMMLVCIVFAMFGMLSPASRGGLLTAAVVCFMFMGLVAGYYG